MSDDKKATWEIIDLTVCIDEKSDECLYINGNAWKSKGESTVYACDIAEAAGDKLIRFKHRSIDTFVEQWPDTLLEALNLPLATTTDP